MSIKRPRPRAEAQYPAPASGLSNRLRELAAQVVEASNRETPADVVLRRTLQNAKGISRADAGAVSNAVFAFFRWRRWLPPQTALKEGLLDALLLDERYAADPQRFPDQELVEKAVPDWIRAELDVTVPWVRSLQSRPRLWLRAKTKEVPTLTRMLRGTSQPYPVELPNTLEFQGAEDLFRTPEFQSGLFEIQDLSSQVVGQVCQPQPGQTWWDACAGEGGKTLHLADLMQNRGLIWASDRSEWRLKRLRQRAARAQVFNYRAVPWDGGAKLPTKTRFDGILVDAPCSGVGTWQRNPQARWTTTAADAKELGDIQVRLLQHVASALKPGGVLVYAVCTLTRSETTAVVARASELMSGLTPFPLETGIAGGRLAGNTLELWPQDCGSNGMFIARWRKAAG